MKLYTRHLDSNKFSNRLSIGPPHLLECFGGGTWRGWNAILHGLQRKSSLKLFLLKVNQMPQHVFLFLQNPQHLLCAMLLLGCSPAHNVHVSTVPEAFVISLNILHILFHLRVIWETLSASVKEELKAMFIAVSYSPLQCCLQWPGTLTPQRYPRCS